MRRRDFTKLVVAGTVAAPAVLTASAAEMNPRVGFLGGATTLAWSEFFAAFNDQLRSLKWYDGKNVDIIHKWAKGKKQDSKVHAQGLAGSCGVIVTAGTIPLQAAIAATSTKPIIVASAAYQGQGLPALPGNVTGFLNGQATYAPNRLAMFRRAVGDSKLAKMAVLANIDAPNALAEQSAVITAAAQRTPLDTVKIDIYDSDGAPEIVTKINQVITAEPQIRSLYVCTDPLITTYGTQINVLAARKGLPTMFQFRDHVVTGGLMSYGPNFVELFRNAASLVDLHLNAKPLPPCEIVKEDLFEVVFNRTTAAALGLPLPSFPVTIID
jgi:putative ABC transport system substrate-binding protein